MSAVALAHLAQVALVQALAAVALAQVALVQVAAQALAQIAQALSLLAALAVGLQRLLRYCLLAHTERAMSLFSL